MKKRTPQFHKGRSVSPLPMASRRELKAKVSELKDMISRVESELAATAMSRRHPQDSIASLIDSGSIRHEVRMRKSVRERGEPVR